MKNGDKGQRPSIKNKFNRRAKRPSRLKRFLAYAAVIVGINTVTSIDDYQMQWLKDKFTDAGARDELTIDERVELGRHVPPGFNAEHIRNYPDFGYDKYTGVPPADARLPKVLEALIDIFPANDNAHLKSLQDLPLDEAEDYANRLIADEGFKQAFSQLDKLQQLEFGAAIIFALRHDGMTGAEREFQSWFVQNYEAPDNYHSWLDGQIDALSQELAQDADLRENLSRWVPRYTYHDVAEAEEQFKLRHAALQKISDKVLETFGYDPVPVFLSVNGEDLDPTANPERLKTTLGLFSFTMTTTGGEYILVNYFDPSVEMGIESTLSDPETALSTILEEAKHATDVFTVHEAFAGRFGRDDPRYAHALALYINHTGEYSTVEYVKLPLLGEIPWSASAYKDQYVERTAKEFAAETNEAFEEKSRTQPKKPARKARPATPTS